MRGDVVICGPIAVELLAGTPAHRRVELWQVLEGLPWAEIDRESRRLVGEIAAALREEGSSVPLTDIEIAVAAAGAGAAVWSTDRDFDRIALQVPKLKTFKP